VAAGDRLSDYNAKRDFAKTREPKGRTGRSRRNALGFYVQMHAARRLHYDLRLEWDGVLLSWAVTRGPSPDPTQKRLAVRTEDHPLSYAQFEGTIPKKEYGGGTVMLWDRGTWTPRGDAGEGLENGKLSFTAHGERMQGGWTLVRMTPRSRAKRENWLLIKERDEHAGHDADELTGAYTTSIATSRTMEQIADGADVPREAHRRAAKARSAPASRRPASAARARKQPARLPRFHKPQLATLADTVPDGNDWLHESKFDGYRCITAVAGKQARCYSRAGHDWSDRFRRIADAVLDLECDSALLDGEIVAPHAETGSQFSALQLALSQRSAIAYRVFDLLELDGRVLRERPLIERKAALRKLLGSLGARAPILYSEHMRGGGDEVLARICATGGEGIVSKKASAPYRGRRTTSWLKIKCTRRQEFVVGGFTPSDKRGRAFASILVGTFDGKRLRYRGRVGSGFSKKDLDALGAAMSSRKRKTPPFDGVPDSVARNARWVRPDLVAEIDFTELTDAGHVRHGVFKGLREDKRAGQVTLERAPRMDAGARDAYRGVRISNPHRVIYPRQGVTKAQLARYYDLIGTRMLPLMPARPVSLLRCPRGRNDKCFFQKHASTGFPDQIARVPIAERSGRRAEYLYIDDIAGLIAGVQMGTVEFHIWGSRIDSLEKPDRLVFDLDPDETLDFEVVALAAAVIRARLNALGLESLPLVTGGKGVHVVAPLRRTAGWPRVKAFAQAFAARLAADEPAVFTATMSKSRRRGRIFIDWLRNQRGATAVAPYSTRERANAPVATPLSWDELAQLQAANGFRIDDVVERLDQPDPWSTFGSRRQSVTARMLSSVQEENGR
jgi:bifunctional non-homologous end joining protein LigD